MYNLGLADLLGAMRLMGREPREMVLMGVQPATLQLGTQLSAPVAAGLERLIEKAVAQISNWLSAEERIVECMS